ncbi:MAG: hypothetical protein K2X39_06530, partial [Silvanigrellaceae bacterium]|nr:hypothetical protein [Silvanigrellaceae bacterium]
MSKRFVFSLLVNILTIFFVLSCAREHENSSVTLKFQPSVNSFDMLAKGYGDDEASDQYTPIFIAISLQGAGGFRYQSLVDLNEKSVTLKIPQGNVSVTSAVMYQKIPLGYTLSDYCAAKVNKSFLLSKNVNEQNGTLYTESTQTFNINQSTKDIKVAFNNSLTTTKNNLYGFIFFNPDGSKATGSVVYLDPISRSPVLDPCTGKPFQDTLDNAGRLAVNIPLFNSQSMMGFRLNSSQGSFDFYRQFRLQPTAPQFFKMYAANLQSSEMDQNSESFLENGLTIAQSISKGINPRFEQFNQLSFSLPSQFNSLSQLASSVIFDAGSLTFLQTNSDQRGLTAMCALVPL